MGFLRKIFTTVVRLFSPGANAAYAILIKTIAGDIARSFVHRYPAVGDALIYLDMMINDLMKATGVKNNTAERVMRSTLYDMGYRKSSDDTTLPPPPAER